MTNANPAKNSQRPNSGLTMHSFALRRRFLATILKIVGGVTRSDSQFHRNMFTNVKRCCGSGGRSIADVQHSILPKNQKIVH